MSIYIFQQPNSSGRGWGAGNYSGKPLKGVRNGQAAGAGYNNVPGGFRVGGSVQTSAGPESLATTHSPQPTAINNATTCSLHSPRHHTAHASAEHTHPHAHTTHEPTGEMALTIRWHGCGMTPPVARLSYKIDTPHREPGGRKVHPHNVHPMYRVCTPNAHPQNPRIEAQDHSGPQPASQSRRSAPKYPKNTYDLLSRA
jgi:hypothetical protein